MSRQRRENDLHAIGLVIGVTACAIGSAPVESGQARYRRDPAARRGTAYVLKRNHAVKSSSGDSHTTNQVRIRAISAVPSAPSTITRGWRQGD